MDGFREMVLTTAAILNAISQSMRRAATIHQLGMYGVMTNVYPLPEADLNILTSWNRFLHWLAISCSTILPEC